MSGHGHVGGDNKKIAILIALLAACLAVSEMGGKSSQTEVLTKQVEASNLWSFFQAKTIRQTVMRTAAEDADANFKDAGNMPAAVKAQVERWRSTAQRYETEPETNEGRKELSARAKVLEAQRDKAQGAYHLFEYGSAAFQLAIVLASAAAVTTVMWLALLAGGLGIIGVIMSGLGFFAPTLVHL